MVETLQLDIYKETANAVDFSLIQGSHITLDNRSYEVGFLSLSISKKMGEVNVVSLEIGMMDLKGEKIFPLMETLVGFFRRRKVTLKIDDEAVAKDYYVFKVTPRRYRRTATAKALDQMSVTLELVSPDKYLSLKPFCCAHTAKRFYKEIVTPELESDYYIAKIAADGSGLRFLGSGDNELIQPYLVQYNESFRDFILRTMNRCGEFLYYEDGKLHFGLEKKEDSVSGSEKTPISLSGYSSLTYRENAHEHSGLTFTEDDFGGHGATSFMTEASETAKWTYVDETGDDEYLQTIEKGNYDSQRGEMCRFKSEFGLFLELFAKHKNYAELVRDYALAIAQNETAAAVNASNANDKYDEKYFDKKKFDSAQYDSAESPSVLSQFGTYGENSDWAGNLYAKFYSFIRNLQENMDCGKIVVEYDNNIQFLKLGDIVKHNDELFVVTSVEVKQTNAKKEWIGGLTAELTPKAKIRYGETDYENWVAPKANVESHRELSGGQLAVVEDAKDPERLARVRVKFKWQTEKDNNLSPWIKTKTMASTPNGGILFMPRKGDEIMVGFVGGNIERPYMMGGVYTQKSGPRGGTRKYDNMISSPNGHSIKFNTVNRATMGANFFRALQPVSWLLASPATLFDKVVDEESSRFPLMGGIEIGDDNGLCSILMSSDERKVSIISSFGNVDISAYTGIKISAPNGDIKLAGRNINIKAGNCINIESGTDCNRDPEKSTKERFKDRMASIGTDIAIQFCDLSLIRTVIETLVKPVEGTLKIKSHKYMMIEAGLGTVEVPDEDYSAEQKKMSYSFKGNKISETLKVITDTVNNNIADYVSRYNNLCKQTNDFRQELTAANIPEDQRTQLINKIKENGDMTSDSFRTIIGDVVFNANKRNIDRWVNYMNNLKKQKYRIFKLDTIEVANSDKKTLSLKPAYFESTDLLNKIGAFIHKDNIDFQEVDQDMFPVNDKTKIKRHALVNAFKDNQKTIKYEGTDLTPWESEDRWRDYILSTSVTTNSKLKEMIDYERNKLAHVFRENTSERKLWYNLTHGQLLISENKGETFKLENGELSRYRNVDYKWIKDCLNFR